MPYIIQNRRKVRNNMGSYYINTFYSKDGVAYGLRFATPEDAKSISKIYKQLYSKYYVNPIVYDVEQLKIEIENKNNFWCIGEKIGKRPEIFGAGVLQKNGTTTHGGRAVIKRKFQGRGLATKLGSQGVLTLLRKPEFKNILKLDTDVRATNIRSQKLAERAGCIGYAFIPGFNNFADKRKFKINKDKPCVIGYKESAILYASILKPLWKKRRKDIHLIDEENILFFYEHFKNRIKKMKEDKLIIETIQGTKNENYQLIKDFYNGTIKVRGVMEVSTLKDLLSKYSHWRILEWRIPTSIIGIDSMHIALENGFKVVGYDIGSINNDDGTLSDSLVLCKYFNEIDLDQFTKIDITDANKTLVNKVIGAFKTN